MPSVTNSLETDQAQQHVAGPDLDPNILKRLSADNKAPLAGKEIHVSYNIYFDISKLLKQF